MLNWLAFATTSEKKKDCNRFYSNNVHGTSFIGSIMTIQQFWKLKYCCRYGTNRQKNYNYPVDSRKTHRKIRKPIEKYSNTQNNYNFSVDRS